MVQSKKQKKQYKVIGRPILTLLAGLGFLSVILLAMMLSAGNGTSGKVYPDKSASRDKEQEEQQGSSGGDLILAIVKGIDLDNRKIELYDVNNQKLISLSYSGGINLTDKYGKIISMSQVAVGSMVDAAYLADKGKLTDMNISTKAWEYAGVSNLGINRNTKVMKIADNKYRYGDDLLILDNGEFIPVTDLAEQDELLIRGFEETIWSITVTRGHGTVIIQDYQNFLGDYITIGYEAMQQITEGMEITVREGNFNLTVENGEYSATKNITVNRNLITYVSLKDLGPKADAFSRITFKITPFGADLLIDGELTSYANPIELTYGKHSIKVTMGGYTSYEGTLTADSSSKTVLIDLPEAASKKEATVKETDSGSNTGTSTGNNNTSGESGDDTGEAADSGDAGAEDADGTQQESPADYSDFDPGDIDETHLIYINEPVGASVYIDGNYMCKAPGSFKKIIGTHVITFIKQGYETMSYTIEIADDNLDSYFTFPNLTAK